MLIDLKLPAAPAQNDIMKAQLAACGAVGVLASEEEDGALVLGDGRQA
jgi:fructose-1,6-bisphosphatase